MGQVADARERGLDPQLAASAFARTDFAEAYDAARPRPPAALLDVLCRYARVERPRLVVDLGCGTGLSAAVWADRAHRVIGVEPAPGMLAVARRRVIAARYGQGAPSPRQRVPGTTLATEAAISNLEFRQGTGEATDLPAGGADVVTAVQAFHWMAPEATLAEVARLLRPGGVFAAADYLGPANTDWEVEEAEARLFRTAQRLRQERASPYVWPRRWPKEGHLESLRRSGHFRFVKEVLLHSEERGDAERYVQLGLSWVVEDLAELRARGVTDEELGLADLRRIVARVIGVQGRWLLSWRVRLGVRS